MEDSNVGRFQYYPETVMRPFDGTATKLAPRLVDTATGKVWHLSKEKVNDKYRWIPEVKALPRLEQRARAS